MLTGPFPQGSLLHSWAHVSDVTRKLECGSSYYPLLVDQVCSDEAVERTSRIITGGKDYHLRAPGWLVEGARIQAAFSSIPAGAGKSTESNRNTHLVNTWLRGWCHRRNFVGFFLPTGWLIQHQACW